MKSLVVLFGLVTATAAAQPAPRNLIVGVGNFSHIVADIDRSVQFYRDVVGLEVAGPTRTFSGEGAMRASNTPGAHSLFASLRVPGSPLGVEIIEYKNVDRKPVLPRFQDPGAANLILAVREFDSIVARAKAAGATVYGTDALARHATGNRAVILRDPDGFFVELVEPADAAQKAEPPANVIGSGFEIVIGDTSKTMRLYRDVLGLPSMVGGRLVSTPLLSEVIGVPTAQHTRSSATIPGSPVTMTFLEFKAIDRNPLRTRFQDPGTPVLQLRVKDIDAATKAWKAAGGEIISADGEPADIGGGLKIIVLRDPNNVMLELIQAATPR